MPTVLRANYFKAWSAVGLLLFATLVCADAPAQKPLPNHAPQTPAQGKQWETDDAVRQGMATIRQSMQANQAGIDNGQLNAQDYQRLATVIDQNLATMVTHRKSAKEAETALHLVVLIDLQHSLELMRAASTVQLQRAGALGVQQALRNYGRYFKHPGWSMAQAARVGDAR